ncbi:gamma-glutamyltransferase [Tuwongella immobilis]|uniref:Glutathione hydrolase proenzyme n=1 Tax=Tuwongella immobilis TaxID=692036 RepID=A0A6C2YPM1_9BACT|nr:gamma-glutamyltransferase [Tuwongella immobilis]VIP03344.1 gamma-glutamyltranspeptidase : Gamma-glutamyltranspeptidase OS=Gemmatimonas aurantiaca (strain T-27 / DSM 14586 / JCM 11422 / NBRC 100505) GN=ggt PE=4 SV=1: G_glu_transpept [Tuwongella immobilis]VTS04060.1 gamma-glutamyltranspeptidase : Gamma-glutamyltranspeptidase OS=Gemmatimonas aurantiaca (strain T-27 / DSM 14586 / JCM 11422 / NBRC 100505) GN=ggt PE=4 SV=1: G_glu_transpept [Tuwongella immobilis]
MRLRTTVLAAWMVLVLTRSGEARPPAPDAPPRAATVAENGMVVCVSPIAADIGVEILKQGGTAVDAAVAVALAEAVTFPEAGNIGGGGFMLVQPPKGAEPTLFDYREKAPKASTPEMLASPTSWATPKAVGVPGTLRGLELAHQKYGKLPWKTLVEPAVRLARDGFPVSQALADGLNIVVQSKPNNPLFRQTFGKNGKGEWQAGDRFIQPDLAKTLTRVMEQGASEFYTGETAKLLAAEMQRSGGLITLEDLANYQAKQRTPIRSSYRGYEIISTPPPSAGGITLSLALNILETFPKAEHPRFSAETIHRMAESMKIAYSERAKYLGDPDFNSIPEHLTRKEHAEKLAKLIRPNAAIRSEALAPELNIPPESPSTTHFSIIDKDGMAVSNTYTLERSYGARIVVPGAGFLLNNEMTDFNIYPGVTDRTGKIGTMPNRIQPNKRMLSSMTPTILRKDGKVVLIVGSPGGRTITNTVMNIIVSVVDYDMEIQAAVASPRVHHQWLPNEIRMESLAKFPLEAQRLRAIGHQLTGHNQGDAHSIWVDPKTGKYHGASDHRIEGKAAGY